MMQFLKNHWISLVSGVVALAAIGATVYGMTRKGVAEEMKNRLAAVRDIDALTRGAKNQECIDAEKERGQRFQEQYDRTREVAERINARQPLVSGVFPRPAGSELAYRFQEVYRDKLYELPRLLKASGPPTEQEIEEEKERIAEEARRRAEQGLEPGGLVPPAAEPASPAVPPASGGIATGAPGGGGLTTGAPAHARPTPGTPAASVSQEQALRRAAVRKARGIRMYAEASPSRTCFHISPLFQAEWAPQPAEMWFAQVGLWIQQDIVNAIRKLNDEAATQLAEEDVQVGNMPVKRIVGIRVHGYINGEGQQIPFQTLGASSGGGVAPRVGSGLPEAAKSFTGRKSDSQFDVVRFSISIIVDQRHLLKLMDAIVRENFYQAIGVEYVSVPPGMQEDGYMYGGAPAVHAVLSFEGYLARKVYKAMMPEEVLQALKIEGGEGG